MDVTNKTYLAKDLEWINIFAAVAVGLVLTGLIGFLIGVLGAAGSLYYLPGVLPSLLDKAGFKLVNDVEDTDK